MTTMRSRLSSMNLSKRIDRLAAEVGTGTGGRGERIGFVDEQDAVERLLALVERLGSSLADIAGDETRAVGLDQMAFAQHVERAINLAERARDLGLAHAGRAGEHHVPADRRDGEPLLAAHALDFERGHELVHLLLDRSQSDHLFEMVQRLIERAFRRGDGRHRKSAPGARGRLGGRGYRGR